MQSTLVGKEAPVQKVLHFNANDYKIMGSVLANINWNYWSMKISSLEDKTNLYCPITENLISRS